MNTPPFAPKKKNSFAEPLGAGIAAIGFMLMLYFLVFFMNGESGPRLCDVLFGGFIFCGDCTIHMFRINSP